MRIERLENEVASLEAALNAFVINVALECDIEKGDTMLEDAERAEAPTSLELIQRGAATNCCRVTGAEGKQNRATTPRKAKRKDRSR
jgi:hypothetical protein